MGLPSEEITLAELLKDKGYHTLMLGKWHLGGAPDKLPQAHGFDEWLGFVHGAALFLPTDNPEVVNSKQDFDPIDKFLWVNLRYAVSKDGGEQFQPKGYLTDYLTDEAVRAIEANRNRPFFMYLCHLAVHTPLQALKSDYDALSQIEDHTTRVYGGMIRALDRSVGRVLQALKENGLEENTIVIFTSDNGGAFYIGLPDINKPYRGWKMTFFEGGLHVPFFMKWPAGLPRGKTYEAPVSHFDIYATTASAAGAILPDDRVIDGKNLIPYLKQEKQGRPHDALFWKSGHYRTVLAGEWKLQTAERPDKDWLFNLAEDPTERVNLAEQNPQKVAELKLLLEEHGKEMSKPAWPALIEGLVTIDHPLNIPLKDDDEFVYWPN
jgi:arylsulfatase A-like enzyme